MTSNPKLTPPEHAVLAKLADASDEYGGGCYFLPFAPIERATGLDRKTVRRACRSLTRKGLAQFARGLWTDEGEMAGAGYGCTEAGLEARAALVAALGGE